MIDRNITVDPLDMACPVDKPEIQEILDLKKGHIYAVPEFIQRHRYDNFIILRGKVREHLRQDPLFKCLWCSVPVYIVASHQKKFFFRHLHEDGSCRAKTRGTLSQKEINAIKYHGLRESEPHKYIKSLAERSLHADRNFSDIKVEKTWRAADDSGSYRRPDVSAFCGSKELSVVFEVQLSTTFLDVVVERRAFYKQENALLVWVLGNFKDSYRRITTDDLLFSNNSNVFVLDDETMRLSEEKGIFHIRCHYRKPEYMDGKIVDT